MYSHVRIVANQLRRRQHRTFAHVAKLFGYLCRACVVLLAAVHAVRSGWAAAAIRFGARRRPLLDRSGLAASNEHLPVVGGGNGGRVGVRPGDSTLLPLRVEHVEATRAHGGRLLVAVGGVALARDGRRICAEPRVSRAGARGNGERERGGGPRLAHESKAQQSGAPLSTPPKGAA
jgi:hypothetical protein